jgi:hypothetical protein
MQTVIERIWAIRGIFVLSGLELGLKIRDQYSILLNV